jgi:hypothetical protein
VMPDVDLTELFGVGQRRPNDLSIRACQVLCVR